MIRTVTKYRAADGSEFTSKREAEQHEREAIPRQIANTIDAATTEQIVAALTGSLSPDVAYVAEAIEKAGAIITRARLAAGGSKRKRKPSNVVADKIDPVEEETA